MLLDLVEVPKLHTGINLADAFEQVLEEFGISDKVCDGYYIDKCHSPSVLDSWGDHG